MDLPTPKLRYSMDVNALNFCRFSLLRLSSAVGTTQALIALPNLVDSSAVRLCALCLLAIKMKHGVCVPQADIWALHDRDRIHAAIGQELNKTHSAAEFKGRNTYGLYCGFALVGKHLPYIEIRNHHVFASISFIIRVDGAGWLASDNQSTSFVFI